MLVLTALFPVHLDSQSRTPPVRIHVSAETPASDRAWGKVGVFADRPGLTVEVFEFENDLVKRNIVYWGAEEVASRFQARSS